MAQAGHVGEDDIGLHPGRLRMVTHLDVTQRDVDAALAAWRRVVTELVA